MKIDQMQNIVDKWVSKKDHVVRYFPPFEIIAQISEEVGEVAREISDLHGFKKKKDSEKTDGLESEIGDLIFSITCLANSHQISLESAFTKTMLKKNNRDAERFTKKNS